MSSVLPKAIIFRCCAVIHADYIALRIAYIEGKHGINSCADGFHDAVLHAVVAEDNDLTIEFGDSLYFAVGGVSYSLSVRYNKEESLLIVHRKLKAFDELGPYFRLEEVFDERVFARGI